MSKKTLINTPKGVTQIWDSKQEKESPKSRRDFLQKEAEIKQLKRQAALKAKQDLESRSKKSWEKRNEIPIEIESLDSGIARIDKEFSEKNPELIVKKKTISEDSAEIAFSALPDNYKTESGESIGKIKKGCVGVKDGKLIKRWHTTKTIKLICQRVDARGITLERLRGFIKL